LLLSHGDSLHIGGAASLLQDFAPQVLIDNPTADRSTVHRRLHELFDERRINASNLNAGESFDLSPEVTAKILFPPRDFARSSADDETFVVQLVFSSGAKILFVSDAGTETENALLGSKSDLRSDILVKGQHHSGQSGSEAFLDAVRPQLIVATSCDFPEHERISDDWADAVRAKRIKLFRQDETGAVEICFRQREWGARAYVTGEIFRSVNR
jgi:competence protein ComEC